MGEPPPPPSAAIWRKETNISNHVLLFFPLLQSVFLTGPEHERDTRFISLFLKFTEQQNFHGADGQFSLLPFFFDLRPLLAPTWSSPPGECRRRRKRTEGKRDAKGPVAAGRQRSTAFPPHPPTRSRAPSPFHPPFLSSGMLFSKKPAAELCFYRMQYFHGS